MPTHNPRITITLTPELSVILSELSDLTGDSKSSIVADLLGQSAPVFERIIRALKAAKLLQIEAEGGIAEIGLGLKRAQERIETQLGLVLDDFDEGCRPILEQAEKVVRRGARGMGAARPRGSRSATTPVPVTRGLGTPKRGIEGEEKPGRRKVKGGKNGGV